MRLKEIEVKGLFKTFDYSIPLNLEEQLTIIHAPNGYGKTVILKLVNSFFNLNFSYLLEVPYDSIHLSLDNDCRVSIMQRIPIGRDEKMFSFSVLKDGERFPDVYTSDDYQRSSLGHSRGEHIDKLLSSFSTSIQYQGRTNLPQKDSPYLEKMENLPKPLGDIIKETSLHSIDTKRLYVSEGDDSRIESVTKYSNDLTSKLSEKFKEYTSLSQKLDRDFPKKLANNLSSPTVYTRESLEGQLLSLEEKRRKLQEIGLSEASDINTALEMNEKTLINKKSLVFLGPYLENIHEKLAVFDDLSPKITLFKDLIDKRFLYKKVTIHPEKGFVFYTQNGEELDPSFLSSGEQHQLVLLYRLLFEIPDNALILIDEPEISLHIVWQKQFLTDLHKIIELKNYDVLIATHNPHIIDDRWDLTVELKAQDQVEGVLQER